MADFDRTQVPAAQKPRPFNFPLFDRFTLKNGLQVIHVPHTKLPLVSIQVCLNAGADHDPEGGEGLAAVAADLLTEGTPSRDAYTISSEMEHLGTHIAGHADWNASFLELNSVKRQLDSSLDLFCDILFNATIPDDEVERARKQLLNQRLHVIDSPGRIASEYFYSRLYGSARYGKPLSGTQKEIAAIDAKALREFFRQGYRPQDATLIIVGDLNRGEAGELSRRYFENWKGKQSRKARDVQSYNQQPLHLHLVDRPGARQAEIRLGHIGIDRHSEDYYACVVLNQILGGYFLSRLNLNLREEKGLTYGINSRFIMRKGAGPFMISSAVDTQHTGRAISEIIREMKKLQQQRVEEKELQNALGYMTGIFPIAFESGLQIAAGLSNIVVHSLEDDYYRTYRERMTAVTAEQVQHAAQKYFHPDELLLVVSADRKEVEKELADDFDLTVKAFKDNELA